MNRWIIVTLCASFCIAEVLGSSEIHVRAKRQQCRCVRNPGGGLTCSCAKPAVSPGGSLATAEYQQQNELAHELQIAQPAAQARCACLQIVFMGNPQYQCHCGDNNGNPLPAETTTTPAPTTTTTPSTTTTTTLAPTTTTPHAEPLPTTVNGNGHCQCIMIRISGPASAHYQCNCQNTPAPTVPVTIPTTTTPLPTPPPSTTEVPVYPPVGTINSTQPGCFCVEPSTQSIQPQCGCACDCVHMLCTMPMAVCACPQDQYGQPVAAHPEEITEAPITLPPVTLPPTTLEPSTLPPAAAQPESSYPLTTTCVMYVGVQASPCTCLPQYDQCAQNICCLKAKYRSYKQNTMFNDQSATEPSTIDMLMNVLQKIKTRLN